VKVLLVSTYELGHQPLGIAAVAAGLLAAGHVVEAADLTVGEWPAAALETVDAVGFSVPMHTACELALEAAGRIRRERPELPVAFYGLYAGVIAGHRILRAGDLLATGEAVAPMLDWLDAAGTPAGPGTPAGSVTLSAELGPAVLPVTSPPARGLLPPLDRYARLLPAGKVVASVEASRGCNHRCRHCPVAAVYRGRSRAVPIESILADLDQVVALGAEHVSFADPDFLNRPRHAVAVAEALAEHHPGLTFDATIKVEHVLDNRELFEHLAGLGLRFVVSAFESTDEATLTLLDKGHSARDEATAVEILRSAGIEPRPSWLPFTPWTTLGSIADLLTFTARADLVANTDLVQFSIRLLLPPGSLLLEQEDAVLAEAIDAARTRPRGDTLSDLAVAWRHRDDRVEELQGAIAALAEAGDAGAADGFEALWELAREAGSPLGAEVPEPDPALASRVPAGARLHLSETWFCCAEPTRSQLNLVRS
jgi:radical SAM superfamily enzyme YgiQ (UPF0313 family)